MEFYSAAKKSGTYEKSTELQLNELTQASKMTKTTCFLSFSLCVSLSDEVLCTSS